MSERGITCKTAREIPGLDEGSIDEDNDENMGRYRSRIKMGKSIRRARIRPVIQELIFFQF